MNLKGLNKEKIYKDRVLKILSFIAIIFLLVVGAEFIIRSNIRDLYAWVNTNIIELFLNMIIIGTLLILFQNIFSRLGYSVLFIGSIYYIMSIISYYKFLFRKEYLYPGDFKLLGEATKIVKEFDIGIKIHIIWSVLLLVWIIFMSFKIQKERRISKIGVGGSLVSLVLISNLYMNNEFLSKIKVQLPDWNRTVEESYDENGYLLSFINSINTLIVEKPEGYDEDKVNSILTENQKNNSGEFKNPNIIMIMSEALFDITKVNGLEFKQDPLENLHKYQENFVGGNIVTSVAIGGTAQTEYEVLTGNSVNFTGESNIGYMNYIEKNTPSISKIMKSEGYHTVAIHPYNREFYSRDKAYSLLGIDEYISMDMFEDPDMKRGYIKDKEAINKVIDEYENNNDKPFFAHIVTMQNHAPYNTESTNDNNIQVKYNTNLSEENKQIISTYADGLKDSDNALKDLIEYFESIDEPTVIVYYGDHIPLLGENQSVFLELDYFNDNDDINTVKYYHTPFMMWNNYGLEKKQYNYLDSSYLGALMLEHIGYNEDEYFNLLNDYRKDVKAYTKNIYIDKNDNIKNISKLSEKEIEILKNWWIVMYDRILGKKYSIRGE